MRQTLVSWNVNGLRAISAKEEWRWFQESGADVFALQETKATPEQLAPELARPEGWHSEWASSVVKKGYSGVAMALNNRMIPRADWGDTPLEEGASIVIIKAACGG